MGGSLQRRREPDGTEGAGTTVDVRVDPLDDIYDPDELPHVVLKRGDKILAGTPGPGVPECDVWRED